VVGRRSYREGAAPSAPLERVEGLGTAVELDQGGVVLGVDLLDAADMQARPAPTWLEIARHRLEVFFRDADAKLEAAGFPLDWLLHRTDAAGLPPLRKASGPGADDGAAIKLPARELARIARRDVDPDEAAEIQAAIAEFHALRAKSRAVSE
jgi:hypothetical protein